MTPPLIDDEGIVYAEIDINRCIEPKQYHDIIGGYNQFDIFKLSVDRTVQSPAHFDEDRTPEARASGNVDQIDFEMAKIASRGGGAR